MTLVLDAQFSNDVDGFSAGVWATDHLVIGPNLIASRSFAPITSGLCRCDFLVRVVDSQTVADGSKNVALHLLPTAGAVASANTITSILISRSTTGSAPATGAAFGLAVRLPAAYQGIAGATPWPRGTAWVKISIVADFAAKTFSVYINDALKQSGLPWANSAAADFSRVVITSNPSVPNTDFDAITVDDAYTPPPLPPEPPTPEGTALNYQIKDQLRVLKNLTDQLPPVVPVPPAAAIRGFNTLMFFDGFENIDSIDMSNTGAPGFNWYIRNAWPNSCLPNWQSMATANPAWLTMANSVLTIGDGIVNGLTMQSAAFAAGGYAGQFIDPAKGFYLEARIAFDPALANPGSWPAVWAMSAEFLLGNTCEYIEPDVFEYHSTSGPILGLHEWAGAVDTPDVKTFTPAATFTNFNTFGFRLTPAAMNNGVGLIERFFNGIKIAGADTTYVPGGLYSRIETQRLCLILGAGHGWPLQIDWIGVWQ